MPTVFKKSFMRFNNTYCFKDKTCITVNSLYLEGGMGGGLFANPLALVDIEGKSRIYYRLSSV